MHLIRALLVIMSALLAACAQPPGSGQPTAASPASGTATSAAQPAPPVDTPRGAATRTVIDARQQAVSIPAAPQRIVSLNPTTTDNLLALGLTPAGIATYNGTDFESYEYVADELRTVPIVGTFVEPNLERILALQPDLIMTFGDAPAEVNQQLQQIAPTLVLTDTNGDFRQSLRLTGALLGSANAAEARITAYEQRAAQAHERLQAAVGDERVAFLRITTDTLRLYGNGRLVGPILYGDLGLTPALLVRALFTDCGYRLSPNFD